DKGRARHVKSKETLTTSFAPGRSRFRHARWTGGQAEAWLEREPCRPSEKRAHPAIAPGKRRNGSRPSRGSALLDRRPCASDASEFPVLAATQPHILERRRAGRGSFSRP